MVHIINGKDLYQVVHPLSVKIDILLGGAVLKHHCADDGGDSQQHQGINRQLDRTEKIPYLPGDGVLIFHFFSFIIRLYVLHRAVITVC